MRNFSRWKNSLAHLDGGRYANDTVVDYLQNKDSKALVFTDKTLVYINLKRHRLRWAFPVAHLSSVTTHGQALSLPRPCLLAHRISHRRFTDQVAGDRFLDASDLVPHSWGI